MARIDIKSGNTSNQDGKEGIQHVCISSGGTEYKSPEVMSPLYKMLFRPHVEYLHAVLVRKEVEAFEGVHKSFTRYCLYWCVQTIWRGWIN